MYKQFIKSIKFIIKRFWSIRLLRSYFLSFKYAGRKGIILPIIISNKTRIKSIIGGIHLPNNVGFGLLKVGFSDVSISYYKEDYSLLNINGVLKIKGEVNLGAGTKIFVGVNAVLEIGSNLLITANSSIVCKKKIVINENCLISWDVLIMDSDAHPIRNTNNEIINLDKPITIGNNVWLGCRSVVLKGANIPDNCIVASNSLVNKIFDENNCIIAGQPGQSVKKNIVWLREAFN